MWISEVNCGTCASVMGVIEERGWDLGVVELN